MTKILTVSISDEQDKAMKEMNLSASKLLQMAIEEKINQFNLGLDFAKSRTQELEKNLENWRNIVHKQRTYIENKGLLDDFIKSEGY
jgi:hypothetical protein